MYDYNSYRMLKTKYLIKRLQKYRDLKIVNNDFEFRFYDYYLSVNE